MSKKGKSNTGRGMAVGVIVGIAVGFLAYSIFSHDAIATIIGVVLGFVVGFLAASRSWRDSIIMKL